MENGNYGHKSDPNAAGEHCDKNEESVSAETSSSKTCGTSFSQLRDFWSNTERGGSAAYHGCKPVVYVAAVPEGSHKNNTQSNDGNVSRYISGNKKYCSEDGDLVTGRKVSSLRPQLQYDNAHPDEKSNYISERKHNKIQGHNTAEEMIHSKSVIRDVHPGNDGTRPMNASHEPTYANTRKHSESVQYETSRKQGVVGRRNSRGEPKSYFVHEENGSIYKDIALDDARIMNDRYSHETRSSVPHGRKSAVSSRRESSSGKKTKGSSRGYPPPVTGSQRNSRLRTTYDGSDQRHSRIFQHRGASTRSNIQGEEFNSRAPAYTTSFSHETQRSSGNARDLEQLNAPMANGGKPSRQERSILYEESGRIPSEALRNAGDFYDDVEGERGRITQEPTTLAGFRRQSFGGGMPSKCARDSWCSVREDELIYEEAIDPRSTARSRQIDESGLRNHTPQEREVGGRRRSIYHERPLDQTFERGSQKLNREPISTDEQIYHDSEIQSSFPQNGAINGRRPTPFRPESHRGVRPSRGSNNNESVDGRRTVINRAIGSSGEVAFEDRFDDPGIDYTLERRPTHAKTFRMVSFSGKDCDRGEAQRAVEMESEPHGDMTEGRSSTVKPRSREQFLRYSRATIRAPRESGSVRASRGGTEQLDEYTAQQRRSTFDERRVTADPQRQPAMTHLIEAEKSYNEFRDVSTEMVDGVKRGGSLLIECRPRFNKSKGSTVIKGTDTTSTNHKPRLRVDRADQQADINAVHDSEGGREKIEVEIIGIIKVSPEECQKICELCGNVLIAKPGENEEKQEHFLGNTSLQTDRENYNGSIADGRSFKAQGRSKSDYNWSFIRKDITDDKERVNLSKSARVVKRSGESKGCFTSKGSSCRQSVRSSHRSVLSDSALSEGSIMTTCDDNDDVDTSNRVTLGLDVEPSIHKRRTHYMNSFSEKDKGNMDNRKRFHILQRVKTESSDSEYRVIGSKKERNFRASDVRKMLNIETYSEDILSNKFNSGHDQKCLPYQFNERKSEDSRHVVPECELAPIVDRRRAVSGENNDNPSIKIHQTRDDRGFIRKRVSHGRRLRLTDPTVHSKYCSASEGELPGTVFPKDITELRDDSLSYSVHENESRTDIEQSEIGTRTDKMKGNGIKSTRAAPFNYPERNCIFDGDLDYKLTSGSKLLHDGDKRKARPEVLKRKLPKQSERQDLLFHNPADDECIEGNTTIRIRRSTSEESWVNKEHFPKEGGHSYIKRISQEDYSSKRFGKKIKKSPEDRKSHSYTNRRRKSFRRYETGEVQCASPLATNDYMETDFFNKHSKKIKKPPLKRKSDVKVVSRSHGNGKTKQAVASSSEEEIGYQLYHSGDYQHSTMTNAKERGDMRGRRIHTIPENNLKLSAGVMSGSISVTSTSLRSESYDFEDQKINHTEKNARYESSHHSVNNNITHSFSKSERRVKMKMNLKDSCYEHMKCSSSDKLTESSSFVSLSHYSTDGKYSYRIPDREDEFLDCASYDSMRKNISQKRRTRGHSRDSRTCGNMFRPSNFSVATKNVKLFKEEAVGHNDDQKFRQKHPVAGQTVCRKVMILRTSQDEYSNSAAESTDFEGVVNGNDNLRLKSKTGTEEPFYDKSNPYESTSYTESVTANENSSAKDLKEGAHIEVLSRSSDESKQFTGQKLAEGNPNEVLRASNLVCDREKNLKYTPTQERLSRSETSMNSSVQCKTILYERKISELRSLVARNKMTAHTIKRPSCTSLRKKITVEKKNVVPDLEKINSEKSREVQFATQEENTAHSQSRNQVNPDFSAHDRGAIHDIAAEKANTSKETTYLNIVMTGKLARVSSKRFNNLGKEVTIEGKQSEESIHVCQGTENVFGRTDFASLNKECSSPDNDCNITGRRNSGGEVKNNVGISFHEFRPSSLSESMEDEWNRAMESVNKSINTSEGTGDQKKSFSSFVDQEKENNKETIHSLRSVEGPCSTYERDRDDHGELSEEPTNEIQPFIYVTSSEINGREYSISEKHSSRNNLPFICKKEASTGSITGSSQWESYQTEDTEDRILYSRNKRSYKDRVYSTDRANGGREITRCNPRKDGILKKRGHSERFKLRKISTEGRYPMTDLCSYTIMEEEREDVAKDSYSLSRSIPVPERQHDTEYGKPSRSKRIIRRRKPRYLFSVLHKEANLAQNYANESTQRGISLKNLFVKGYTKGDDKQDSKTPIAFCKGTSVRYLGEVKQCGIQIAPMRPSSDKKARETGLIQSKECYFKNCNRVKRSLLASSVTDNLNDQSEYSYSTRLNSTLSENVVDEYVKQKTDKYIPAIILLKERKQPYSRDQEGNKTGMKSPNVKRCGKCGKVKNINIKKLKTAPSKKKRTVVAKKYV